MRTPFTLPRRRPGPSCPCLVVVWSLIWSVVWLPGWAAAQAGASSPLEEAQQLLEQRRFADAGLLLNRHLEAAPEDAEALLLRGIQHENRLHHDAAMRDYAASLAASRTPEALYRLGKAHLQGFSDQSEQATGLVLLEQAMQLGKAAAGYELAAHLLNRQPDHADAHRLLEEAVRQGHLEAILVRARMYKYGLGSVVDPELALALYLQAADIGDAEAQYEVGQAYRYGLGVQTDPLQAQFWNGKAFSQGDWRAQWMLGNDLYREGQESMAVYEYWRSATAGFLPARINLGLAYMHGRGVNQHYGRAAFWFASAGTAPAAQWYLGQLLLLGRGVQQDLAGAFRLFTEAAPRMGSAKACLAMMYLTGTGTEQNRKEARRLFRELGEADDAATLNQAAWTLATLPLAELRSPARALKLARAAVALEANAAYVDTLAAAWAASGRIGKALKVQREALVLAVEPEPYVLEELEAHLQAYEAGEPWLELLKDRPAGYEEVREASLLSEFTGEVVDLFPYSQERNPQGYQVEGNARYGLVILVSQVQKGQLPHFMRERAVFYIDSPGSFFGSVYPALPAPLAFPKGIHRFILSQVNLHGDWYYRLDIARRAEEPTANPTALR